MVCINKLKLLVVHQVVVRYNLQSREVGCLPSFSGDVMFNFDKKIGEGSEIFFGKPKGIYDTIVVSHPRLHELYLA